MVNEVEKRGLIVCVCELCRSAYGDLEMAMLTFTWKHR